MSNEDQLKLFTALHRLLRQMHRFSHRAESGHGHYRELSRLLLLIAENDGIIQRDLAEEMDVRPSSMTEMLLKMERLGLVVRKQDEKDQRVMHIYLTDEGKNAAEESSKATGAMADAMYQSLTEEEIGQLLALIEKLSSNLEKLDTPDMDEFEGDFRHGHPQGFGGCHHRHFHPHEGF
jgi:DNA-binding MarR family transcriptional regulator